MTKLRGKISKKLTPETKLNEAVREWLAVTHEFNEWRHQLNEIMTAYNESTTDGLYIGDQLAIANLNMVYLELTEAMEKLSSDVDQMDERKEIKLDQLVEHTKTIRQWSQKVRYVLSVHASGAA